MKILNCRISVSFYFLAVFCMFVLTSNIEILVAFMLSIFHEFGHLFSILLSKRKIKEIRINLFSIEINEYYTGLSSYKKDYFVLISGSFFNIIIFLISKFFYKTYNINLLKLISVQSLLIGLFNLLPILSLDGGHIVLALLEKHFDFFKSQKISFIISITFLIPVATIGFYLFVKSRFNFSMLLVSLYLSLLLILREKADQ